MCHTLGLVGVHQPFWETWGLADPCVFLTVDVLHAWHKFYFDHCVKWMLNIGERKEVDARLAALQPRVGGKHFRNGISTLKQITGREHRDLQKVMIPVIADIVPDTVLSCLRAITEFFFTGQGLLMFDEHLHSLADNLAEFHHFKSEIPIHKGRVGKHGPIYHFKIPKLEGLHRVVKCTKTSGAVYQFSTDTTERCHITHVKDPFKHSNRRNFHEQCCRFMDRVEKTDQFRLFVSLKAHGASLVNEMINEASEIANHYPEQLWLSRAIPEGETIVAKRSPSTSLFDKSHSHLSNDASTAFVVSKKPHAKLSIHEAAASRNLSDFWGALGDYFVRKQTHTERRGTRRSAQGCGLPFNRVRVWDSFRMQQTSTQDPSILLPSRTIQALPPSNDMPYGRCNTVLMDDGEGDRTSNSISEGDLH